MTSNGFLRDALAHARRGWAIVPVKNAPDGRKKAACTWEKHQLYAPSETELHRYFARKNLTGLAVLLGPVSGGLCCRDFDSNEAYTGWAAQQPDLARTRKGQLSKFCKDCKIMPNFIRAVDFEGMFLGVRRNSPRIGRAMP